MQIQKGLVKYKDRSDIVCTYGLTEDGKQYYFLDGNSIANGNIIASTVLVEAIDPVVAASSVGVIDPSGNVVIPFEYKSIKAISDNLLLVEQANSTTPSVVEAVSLRSDPLAATKLVTTAATIKDNMNAKMGSEGRFVFNDQFSEATIYDITGKNIIDDQFYSFIGMKNNEALYFSKNTADSAVVEYSLIDHMFIAPPEPVNPTALDVQSTEVTQETIDGAMAAEEKVVGFGAEDITAKDFEAVANENMVNGGAPVEEPLPVEPTVASPDTVVEPAAPVAAAPETPVEESSTDEEPESVIPAPVVPVEEPAPVEPAASEEIAPVQEEVVTQEVTPEVSEEAPIVPAEEVKEEVKEETPVEEKQEEVKAAEVPVEKPVETEAKDDQLMSFDFGDNINYSDTAPAEAAVEESFVEDTVNQFKSDLFDVDLDTDIFADSTVHADSIVVEDNFDYGYKVDSSKDTIIEDVASTMTNLINLNRSQRQKIAAYEEKFEQAAVAHKKVVEKARSQIRDIETLKAKLKNYETIVAKLEAKISVLEDKTHEQEKVIANQTRELDSLRPQIEGKAELAKILADAQSLLDQQ